MTVSAGVALLLVSSCLVVVTWCEPVMKCLSEDVFQKASCQEIKNYVSGPWAEVRRLHLPFAMYKDDDCVIWNVAPRNIDTTSAEFHLQAFVHGHPVEGMRPAVLKLNEDPGTGHCEVNMHLEVPKLGITRSIEDWWITFDDDHQVMVGYVCIPNRVVKEREEGLLFRNMLFIYLKPQLSRSQVYHVKSNLDIIVERLSKELEDLEKETHQHFRELQKSKCRGF